MEFINNRKVCLREIKVGDIILSGNSKYMIIFDMTENMYGFVNMDTGFCSSGFKTINKIVSQFDANARCYDNDEFKLILE